MITNLFATTIAKVLGALSAALLIACAALWIWGHHGYASAAKWEARAGVEAENHRITKANFRAAQDAAATQAHAARIATEAQYRAIAERADHEKDLAAATRFADARRVPACGGTADGAPGSARAGGEGGIASGGDRSSADAVVIDRAAFDLLAGNTVRLEQARAWGEALIAAGLAVGE